MYTNRVPKVEVITPQNVPQVMVAPLQHQQQQQQQQQPVAQLPNFKDDEKMPLFLIKLWSIVEDPQYQQIVRWDESGYSFHIIDPYSFCRNVLPHFFKHNNLNSLIRQLNMYGFRKMTPVDRGSLARTESDQDHLEFSHPYFIRDHPEFLVNIKRKQSSRSTENSTNGVQAQATIQLVMEEMRQLREKQRTTDSKMHELVKENEQLWEQVTLLRAQHNRQQQVVTKLVQFLVAMMQPNSTVAKRVMKRGVLAIDEPPQKRMRMNSNLNSNNTSNLTDILDRLQREMLDIGGIRGVAAAASRADGPIIADVTDEWVPGASSSSPHSQAQRNKQPFGNTACNMSPNMQVAASPSASNSTVNNAVGLPNQRRVQKGDAPVTPQTNGTTLSPAITVSPSLERQFSQVGSQIPGNIVKIILWFPSVRVAVSVSTNRADSFLTRSRPFQVKSFVALLVFHG
ncbi:Heat shock factor protein 2 [Trichostrongylus colubriformis]|uniref:Heat shock factor protein 2 n=1 Tax=Trichostrongylus colubriformis TaxID=6319 RepID=A0AAN8FM03_TRICO